MKLIITDVETGGLDPSYHSLLSIAMIMYDTARGEGRGGKITSVYTTDVLPVTGTYHVDPDALKVNKIDLLQHSREARHPEVVAQEITRWVSVHAGDEQPIIAGWNVQFDCSFLREFLGRDVFGRLFSYRTVDIHAIIAYKSILGEIPYTKSLEKAAKYFGILKHGKTQPHSAYLDAIITAQLLRKLLTSHNN